MVVVDEKHPGNEQEEAIADVLFGAASKLVSGRVSGVLVIANMEKLTGHPRDFFVRLVSAPDDRAHNFYALARFLAERLGEIPTRPTEVG